MTVAGRHTENELDEHQKRTPTVIRTRAAIALLLSTALPAPASAATPPNLAKAIEEQRKLAEESAAPGVLNDLANLLVLAGQRGEAESIYRRVLTLDAANDEARFNLGLLLQSRGDIDEAEDLYMAVTERQPGNPWPFYQLGVIYESRAQRRDAIDAYGTALALDPQLYFADVNPQVLRNNLLTESILAAAGRRQNRSLAPMQYSRPRQITQMLLSLPTLTGDAAGAATTPQEPLSAEDEEDGN